MAHGMRSPRLQPGERRALANELLLQQYQFRQNVAYHHGLPQPPGPIQLTGVPAESAAPNAPDVPEEPVAPEAPDVPEEPVAPEAPDVSAEVSTGPDVDPTDHEDADSGETTNSKPAWWKKAALAAALLSGLGAGVGLPPLARWLSGSDPPAIVQPIGGAELKTTEITQPVTTQPASIQPTQQDELLSVLRQRGYADPPPIPVPPTKVKITGKPSLDENDAGSSTTPAR